MEATGHISEAGIRAFATTQWSVVLAASADSAQRGEALEQLCRTYWPPVYAYVRCRGHDSHTAQDLTQAFFASLLSRKSLEHLHPGQGKFRSFLVASVNHFLANERDRNHAAKRGGGQALLSLEDITAEDGPLMKLVSHDDPERALDRRWAVAVLNRALHELKTEFAKAGREAVFERLKRFLEEEVRPGDYRGLASDLGMTSGAVAVAVHRLRQRYRDLVRREIAQTVASPAEVEEEVRHLLAVLSP
ncbi:MAG: sigma-70 family RNA polymerase sigma factor [Verrucomicrobia bacterium]|nr:sigma-70 family RNA polymerase sigma factor [Verrucomicrobiota bacterium]